MMDYDLKQVSYSRYGSYFSFTELEKSDGREGGLYLRTVQKEAVAPSKQVFLLETTEASAKVAYTAHTSPEVLKMQTKNGCVDICIDESGVIRIRGTGAGLRLTAEESRSYDYAMNEVHEMLQINLFSQYFKLMIKPLKGSINTDAPWIGENSERIIVNLQPDEKDKTFEVMIKEFRSSCTSDWPECTFDDSVELNKKQFHTWLEKTPETDAEYFETRELAAYINWSSIVSPRGNIKRPSMFMSKNWMTNVWSWDHCFNAMALYNDMDMAFEQLLTVFDNQDEYGALPDSFNIFNIVFNFCKPPIHGWAIKYLMKKGAVDNKHLDEIYLPLCRWTEWWFKYRDCDEDGIPQYNHGNDSGWDNSTVFAQGVPVESPDLCAFLVIQMEALSEIAAALGKTEDACQWKAKSDALLNKMISEFWDGRKFTARHAYSHKAIDNDSLLIYIPIVLGKRLPEHIIQAMVNDLSVEEEHLTRYGLATEKIGSPYYKTNGYWRGPIWAPPTMLIVDGLIQAQALLPAKRIARSFCDMAVTSGMAENYDAVTGQGLRDRAYTWTASVFLMLANELTESLKD